MSTINYSTAVILTTLNVLVIEAEIHPAHASSSLQHNEGKMMQQSWILMCEMGSFPAAGRAFEALTMIGG